MWGISCLAEKLLSVKLELCPTELVACVGFEVLVQAAIMSTLYWNATLNIHVRRTSRICSTLRMEVVISSKHWYLYKELHIFAFQ
jgi:hypothetical protein